MIKYIGLFFVASGFSLFISKKRRDEGKETWEENHGITVRMWHIVVCILLGSLITFGSVFYSNIKEFATKGVATEAVSSADVKEVCAQEVTGSEEVGAFSPENDSDSESLDSEDEESDHLIEVGGVPVQIDVDDTWEPYYGEYSISCYPDGNTLVDYSDSYVPIGDKERLQTTISELESTYSSKVEASDFEVGDQTAYCLSYSDDGIKILRILQPVPSGENYLEIEIVDFTGEKELEKFVDSCLIKF